MAKWEQLIDVRNRMHLSQEEAAERVNVGLVTYQRWEQGKRRPQPHHMRNLCETFGRQLVYGEQDACQEDMLAHYEGIALSSVPGSFTALESSPRIEEKRELHSLLKTSLTAYLWFLAFQDHVSLKEKCNTIRQAIEEFDSMNADNKNYQITRREALCSLAALPMITLSLGTPGTSMPVSRYKSALEQCTASIEACWQLRKSDNASDRTLAFRCASTYLSTLKTIAHNSGQYRKEALELATQYATIKAFVARHYIGLAEAIQYGKEALALSQEAGDLPLQIHAHLSLTWSYFYAKKPSFALKAAQEAEALVAYPIANTQPLHPCIQGKMYSALAIMQARNGLSPDVSLGKAIETNPGNEGTFIEFKRSNLLLEAGWTYGYAGNHAKAMEWLEQRVDAETLLPKIAQSAIGRVETINVMTLSSLRARDRDMERTIHFWQAALEGAQTLHSEQRLSEVLTNYELMEAIWPGEPRIVKLRELLVD